MRDSLRRVYSGRFISFLALALFTFGCSAPKPPAYNVTVALDESLHDSSMTYPGVDVFFKGITDFEYQQSWMFKKEVEDYSRYRGANSSNPREHVLQLGADESREKLFPNGDSIWAFWAADPPAKWLVVIANYPRSKPSSWAGAERRMLIIPLRSGYFPGDNLRIEVTANGLKLQTRPLTGALPGAG